MTLSFFYLSPHRGWGRKTDLVWWVKALELLNKFEATFTLKFVWYQVRLEGRVPPVAGFLDVGNRSFLHGVVLPSSVIFSSRELLEGFVHTSSEFDQGVKGSRNPDYQGMRHRDEL